MSGTAEQSAPRRSPLPSGGTPGSTDYTEPDSIIEIDVAGTFTYGKPLAEMEEDLYSVFRARSELMQWTAIPPADRERIWSLHEADMRNESSSPVVGSVQVGLPAGSSVPKALIPLVRCTVDALGRLGKTDVSGIAITASRIRPASPIVSDLISGLNWFTAMSFDSVPSKISITYPGISLSGPELADQLGHHHLEPFRFDLDHQSGDQGGTIVLTASLPEWSADAAGYAMAVVLDVALAAGSGEGSVTKVQVDRGAG